MDFDVVLGIDSASFSAGVDQLNKDPKAHDTFFKGEYQDGLASGTWEVVGQSPAFKFEPPTAEKWRDSIGPDGNPPPGPPPTDNVFFLSIPSLHLKITIDDTGLPDVYPAVEFYARAVLDHGTASLTPLAVWADESKMTTAEKSTVNGIILPKVFKTLGAVLSGHKIAPQTITVDEIVLTLTAAGILVADTHLVVVAKGDTSTAVPLPSTWPAKPVFAIVNRTYAEHLAASAAAAHKNTTLYDNTVKNTGASLSVKAVLVSVDDITIDQDDATSWSGDLNVAFDATASAIGVGCALKKSSDSL